MMQLSLHSIYISAQAIGAGLLLGPFAVASLQSERWPILVLSCLSIVLISGNTSIVRDRPVGTTWMAPVALAMLILGLVLSVNKLLLIAGILLLTSVFLTKMPLPRCRSIAIIACACLMVPLPAALETELATSLAYMEASMFVAIGQAMNLPVRLSGAQIFFEHSVVTINQDCSGTLLLIPALLGSITAATLSRKTRCAVIAISLALPGVLLINLVRLAIVLGLLANGNNELADEWHDILGFSALAFSWVAPLWLFADLEAFNHRNTPWIALSRALPPLLIGGLASVAISMSDSNRSAPKLHLPTYVSGWVAEDFEIPPEEIRILNADHVSRRRYTSENGEFLLTIIYHGDPGVGREHSSERCFRAMGWQVEKHDNMPVEDANLLTFLTVSSGGHRQAVVEYEAEYTKSSGGLLRIQLVTSPELTKRQQQDLILQFTKKTLGDET